MADILAKAPDAKSGNLPFPTFACLVPVPMGLFLKTCTMAVACVHVVQ